MARLDPSGGFDDFVLMPYVPAELYARIRALEWRRSEFATEERLKVGEIVVDKAAHEVIANGRPVSLTAKEFALLAFLCERRGKALSREQLLAKVWGTRYEGGPRTVDIHVRRLRAKLGDESPARDFARRGLQAAQRLAPSRKSAQARGSQSGSANGVEGKPRGRRDLAGLPFGYRPRGGRRGGRAPARVASLLVGSESVVRRAAAVVGDCPAAARADRRSARRAEWA